MGATPSNHDDNMADAGNEPEEDSDDDDILKMDNGRFRVSLIDFSQYYGELCYRFMSLGEWIYMFIYTLNVNYARVIWL